MQASEMGPPQNAKRSEFCGEEEGFAKAEALMVTSKRKLEHNSDAGPSSSG